MMALASCGTVETVTLMTYFEPRLASRSSKTPIGSVDQRKTLRWLRKLNFFL